MDQVPGDDIRIREANELDAQAIVDLFLRAYGSGYVHPQFYDVRGVTRIIFDERSLVLVATEGKSGQVVGTAGVLYEMGAHADLVGEFGRLVVRPDWRGRGIGNRLMEERLARLGGRLHMAFVEVRVGTPQSPMISQAHGFVPVGFLPQKLVFGGKREHTSMLVKHFGTSLALRKNHPRVIPEAGHLAEVALRGVGLTPDVILDEEATAYPGNGLYELDVLTTEAYPALLRIERGRVRRREVFGPQRLHYGLFKLAESQSEYLVAREGDRLVGALGFTTDEVERHARIFEVVYMEEDAVRFLVGAFEERCQEVGTECLEVDVGADATRMQRTLLEMGYLPAAYVPAMAFDEVERVDIVRMYRLLGPLLDLPFEAPEPTKSVGQYVLAQFEAQQRRPTLARAMADLDLCAGLTEEQTDYLMRECWVGRLPAGERLFSEGDRPDRMIVVLSGCAAIDIGGEVIGTVGPRESLGEVALLSGHDHAASAIAQTDMDVGVIDAASLKAIVRRRPDIGTVVYRNLARGLGDKLHRADGISPPDQDPDTE